MQPIIKRYVHIVLIVWVFAACDTSSNVEPRFNDIFIKYYGGNSGYEAIDFALDVDGGFIVVGNRLDSADAVFIKTDNKGNELERAPLVVGFNYDSLDVSSVRVIAEGYLVGGRAVIPGDSSRIFVAKYSGVGSLISSQLLSVDSFQVVSAGQVNESSVDGSVLVAGSGRFGNKTQTLTWKLTSDLTIDPSWSENIISGSRPEDENIASEFTGVALFNTSRNNEFLVFGTTDQPENESNFRDETFYSRRLITGASPELERNYGSNGTGNREVMSDAIQYTASDYLMVGTLNENQIAVSTVKVTFNGPNPVYSSNTLNINLADDQYFGISGNTRTDGIGFLITGEKRRSEVDSDVFLLSVDGNGIEQWEEPRLFGFEGISLGKKVFQNPDGSIMLLATVSTAGGERTRKRIALIKTNSQGELK